MKIKCISDGNYYLVSLKVGKIYDARQGQKGWFSFIDETGEEYAYPPKLFEVVEMDAEQAKDVLLKVN